VVKAVRIDAVGGPEVMQVVDVNLGAPGEGQVQVNQKAIGLNFIDVYYRTGQYPMPLPMALGLEGAGVIEAVGPGVSGFSVGERVAYAGQPLGAYATARNMPTNALVKIPDGIDDKTAAAMMLKGLTVQYLFRRTFKLQAGQTILFHAAAGGVGLIAMQWAKALGVTVIGTVGTEEKAALAKAHGCDHTILYRKENIVERVKEITNGAMVPVVYDSVGKDTFQASLDSLAPFGTMVSFGGASGPVPPLALTALKGSLFITRPSLMPYTAKRSDLDAMAKDLIDIVSSQKVKLQVNQTYAFADVAQAHRDLEAGKTTGSTVLMP
jgi:NADPH:quinone reductase